MIFDFVIFMKRFKRRFQNTEIHVLVCDQGPKAISTLINSLHGMDVISLYEQADFFIWTSCRIRVNNILI